MFEHAYALDRAEPDPYQAELIIMLPIWCLCMVFDTGLGGDVKYFTQHLSSQLILLCLVVPHLA